MPVPEVKIREKKIPRIESSLKHTLDEHGVALNKPTVCFFQTSTYTQCDHTKCSVTHARNCTSVCKVYEWANSKVVNGVCGKCEYKWKTKEHHASYYVEPQISPQNKKKGQTTRIVNLGNFGQLRIGKQNSP